MGAGQSRRRRGGGGAPGQPQMFGPPWDACRCLCGCMAEMKPTWPRPRGRPPLYLPGHNKRARRGRRPEEKHEDG